MANASLPSWLETRLRLVLVTPDLHRIHHSADEGDFARNFATCVTDAAGIAAAEEGALFQQADFGAGPEQALLKQPLSAGRASGRAGCGVGASPRIVELPEERKLAQRSGFLA